MNAALDGEGYADMLAAIKDPVSMTVTVTGQNGHQVSFAYNVHEDEKAEVETQSQQDFIQGINPFDPPVKTSRWFMWKIEMRKR